MTWVQLLPTICGLWKSKKKLEKLRSPEVSSDWLAKIFVLENVRRRPDQTKTDPALTSVTLGKSISIQHDHLMRNTMGLVVNDLIDPRLPCSLSRTEQLRRAVRMARMGAWLVSAFCPWMFKERPQYAERGNLFLGLHGS
jgi:hypothetical protein